MNNDLISRSELKKVFANWNDLTFVPVMRERALKFIDNAPTVAVDEEIERQREELYQSSKKLFDTARLLGVERPQDELTADEKRLIGVAVEYLLGAELLDGNGWSENDIKVLQSLYERYYVEDSEEEE